MERLLMSILMSFFIINNCLPQGSFKKEAELISYTDKYTLTGNKSKTILFIQNLVCAKGCDPYVYEKVSKVIIGFPSVQFNVFHTLPGDTMFAANSYLAKLDNVKIFCDKNGDFRREGLDFVQHKIFIIKDNKVLWWSHFDSSTIKVVLKTLKKYHKEGLI